MENLFSHHFPAEDYDINPRLIYHKKSKQYEKLQTSMLHICIPYNKNFQKNVILFSKKFSSNIIIIQSMISFYTTLIQKLIILQTVEFSNINLSELKAHIVVFSIVSH